VTIIVLFSGMWRGFPPDIDQPESVGEPVRETLVGESKITAGNNRGCGLDEAYINNWRETKGRARVGEESLILAGIVAARTGPLSRRVCVAHTGLPEGRGRFTGKALPLSCIHAISRWDYQNIFRTSRSEPGVFSLSVDRYRLRSCRTWIRLRVEGAGIGAQLPTQ
jgi:hypothetical protein